MVMIHMAASTNESPLGVGRRSELETAQAMMWPVPTGLPPKKERLSGVVPPCAGMEKTIKTKIVVPGVHTRT
jgi:hypothetical protein